MMNYTFLGNLFLVSKEWEKLPQYEIRSWTINEYWKEVCDGFDRGGTGKVHNKCFTYAVNVDFM